MEQIAANMESSLRPTVANIVTEIPIVIYCEYEGVLADFQAGVQRLRNNAAGPIDIWDAIAKADDFYKTLPWTKKGHEIWTQLIASGVRVVVVTVAATERRARQMKAWCSTNLGTNTEVVVISDAAQITKYCKSPKDFLICNTDKLRTLWENRGGRFLQQGSLSDISLERQGTTAPIRNRQGAKAAQTLQDRVTRLDNAIRMMRAMTLKTRGDEETQEHRPIIHHVNAAVWSQCCEHDVDPARTPREVAIEAGPIVPIARQKELFTMDNMKRVAQQLVAEEQVIPVGEITAQLTNDLEDAIKARANERRHIQTTLEDIKRTVLRDTKLWDELQRTIESNQEITREQVTEELINLIRLSSPAPFTATDGENTREQTVAEMFALLQLAGEEEDPHAERMHELYMGESAAHSFHADAPRIIE
jgi:hypothetical protein